MTKHHTASVDDRHARNMREYDFTSALSAQELILAVEKAKEIDDQIKALGGKPELEIQTNDCSAQRPARRYPVGRES